MRDANAQSDTKSFDRLLPLALRPREAAKALGISERTLWALSVPRGSVPCLRLGSGRRQTVLYPTADLQAWLSRQAQAEKGGDDDNG